MHGSAKCHALHVRGRGPWRKGPRRPRRRAAGVGRRRGRDRLRGSARGCMCGTTSCRPIGWVLMTNLGVCSIEGCDKPFEARGYCIAHYRRWRRHGNPTAGGTPWGEPEQYFLEIVLSFTSDECLLWPYHKGSNGYGMLWRDNRQQGVHRLACEAIHGPPPTPKHEAAHLCGKGHNGCCNPQHVRWATPAENCADALAHGTQARGER